MKYYQRIPAAAGYMMFDGKMYANVTARLNHDNDGRISVIEDDVDDYRMLEVSFIRDGEAYVYIGYIGSAVANIANLPFSVSAFE